MWMQDFQLIDSGKFTRWPPCAELFLGFLYSSNQGLKVLKAFFPFPLVKRNPQTRSHQIDFSFDGFDFCENKGSEKEERTKSEQ